MRWRDRAAALLLAVAVAGLPVSPAGAAGDFEHVAGGPGEGPAVQVGIDPRGLVVADGKLEVVDAAGLVRQVDLATGLAAVYAGVGPFRPGGSDAEGAVATDANLGGAGRAARDAAGNLYLAVTTFDYKHLVRKIRPDGTVVTVAGMRTWGSIRDGVPATQSALSEIYGLAADPVGNLYIGGHSQIRRVDPSGTITTYAGTGYSGFSGDGGPVSEAKFSGPQRLGVTKAGDLFIGDSGNGRIRRVDATTGTVTTVAGGGTLTVDGAPGTLAKLGPFFDLATSGDGSVVFSDSARTRKLGTDGMVTTVAQRWGYITADDAGNVYVGQTGSVIRVASDGVQSPVAGNGTASTSGDGGSATNAQLGGVGSHVVDTDGAVYFVSSETRRIRVIERDGTVRTFVSPGDGTGISSPSSLALHGGHLYVLDYSSTLGMRVLRIHLQTRRAEVLAGGGVAPMSDTPALATSVGLGYVTDIAVDSAGSIYLAHPWNARVYVVSDGLIRLFAGSKPCDEEEWYRYDCSDAGDGGPAVLARISIPVHVEVDGEDNVYISSWTSLGSGGVNIRRVDAAGVITSVARVSSKAWSFAVSKEGDAIYTAYQEGYPYTPYDYVLVRITPGLYLDDRTVLPQELSEIDRMPRSKGVAFGSVAIGHRGDLIAEFGAALYKIADPGS